MADRPQRGSADHLRSVRCVTAVLRRQEIGPFARIATIVEASAKPASDACPWCADADWRWNGFDWYAADRATHRLHVCMTPEAVADRSERETRANRGGFRRALAKLRL
jgi:hypothetical protein